MDTDNDLESRINKANKDLEKLAPEKSKEPIKDKGESRKGADAGITLVVSIVLCAWVGKSIDTYFSTSPLWLIIFLLLGIATGFYTVYKATKQE